MPKLKNPYPNNIPVIKVNSDLETEEVKDEEGNIVESILSWNGDWISTKDALPKVYSKENSMHDEFYKGETFNVIIYKSHGRKWINTIGLGVFIKTVDHYAIGDVINQKWYITPLAGIGNVNFIDIQDVKFWSPVPKINLDNMEYYSFF